jgi:hypothetical protein
MSRLFGQSAIQRRSQAEIGDGAHIGRFIHLFEHHLRHIALEGGLSGESFVDEDGQAVLIGTAVYLCAHKLFRGHISQRPW